jgi:MFS family permease
MDTSKHPTPPHPTPRRIYYGWIVLAVAMVAGSFSTGLGVWGVSIFLRPMTEALGWSRSSFFAALTVRSLVAGVLAPFIGPLLDTPNGPRRLMLLSAVLLGVSLMGVRFVNNIWEFYLLFGVVGGIAQVTGANSLTHSILPKWFVRKRGRVLGIAAMGPGLGPMIFPVSIQSLIEFTDWRTAWFVLGIVAIAILVPMSFLVRTRPEDMGLLPDGDIVPPEERGEGRPRQPRRLEGLTRSEGIRTPAFWLIVVSFMLVGIGIGGFHANLVPFFQDAGLSAGTAALSGTAFAICSVSTRPIWGILAERVPVRYILGPLLIMAAGSVLLVLNVGGKPSMLIAAGVHGVAIGAYISLQGLVVADYFGRAHLGAINGMIRPFMTGAGALSPLMIAVLFDLRDSYTVAFLIIAVGWLFAGVLMFMASPPAKRTDP